MPCNSLVRSISPPPTRKGSKIREDSNQASQRGPSPKSEVLDSVNKQDAEPTLAAVEAGHAQIKDHLEYFVKHLSHTIRPNSGPRLSTKDFQSLYKRNQHAQGHHFVIHQHDHPISGVHYDLRLQFSETSSISFAVPYGMPGNANSQRPNRMAIETRVHNVWNNLIESASHATGSLLIWDTGEYEVMPRPNSKRQKMTDDELSDLETPEHDVDRRSESEKLFAAFQSRHIHLRLHGTRLPSGYTVALRLPSTNRLKGPSIKPRAKRRRVDPAKAAQLAKQKFNAATNDTESDELGDSSNETVSVFGADEDAAIASEDDSEDAAIRANNAYSGSENTIGSVHQRHWFLTLDRKYSGFHKERSGSNAGRWVGGWEDPFFVRGRDVERSVVTGRNADEVMDDEGVEQFVGRKMWRPILE
ncbi:hypothetical protein KC331_g12364 [Hortaea werneckii]|uniref:DNA ligase D 3'-phosphoesterase domain-containing protein n=1 Tax=Hortaea werneckii TaxID=91943 RepID=A0A3M7DBZ9_HORWE|nr:hypothetical protein KC331_g12364 [Hortaea werneckii]KAI7689619.1 hypothetical protein KC353_g19523 [Hortaea werneckii]RMY61663.1 hypothetical protein D0865_00859 [Hortaea werneckii]